VLDFLFSWKILILFGLQLVVDSFNCYLGTVKLINGIGVSGLPIVPIFLTVMQVVAIKFYNFESISYFQIFVVIILSTILHFSLSDLLPHILAKLSFKRNV
jgi:hypothetical protein